MSRFPVVSKTPGGSTLVELSGEIDLLVAPQITKCLDAVTRGPRPRVVVDLRLVTFIDCRGLAVLVRARSRVEERAGKLSLVAADRRLLQILRRTGLDGCFSVHAELDAASTAVAPGVPNPAASA